MVKSWSPGSILFCEPKQSVQPSLEMSRQTPIENVSSTAKPRIWSFTAATSLIYLFFLFPCRGEPCSSASFSFKGQNGQQVSVNWDRLRVGTLKALQNEAPGQFGFNGNTPAVTHDWWQTHTHTHSQEHMCTYRNARMHAEWAFNLSVNLHVFCLYMQQCPPVVKTKTWNFFPPPSGNLSARSPVHHCLLLDWH